MSVLLLSFARGTWTYLILAGRKQAEGLQAQLCLQEPLVAGHFGGARRLRRVSETGAACRPQAAGWWPFRPDSRLWLGNPGNG